MSRPALVPSADAPGRPGESATVVVLPGRDVVLLPLEARARGFRSPRAFKDWCRRHNIAVIVDNKMLFVRVTDVDDALARLPSERAAANDPGAPEASTAVDAFVRGGGRR
jgi:hypothetical protein